MLVGLGRNSFCLLHLALAGASWRLWARIPWWLTHFHTWWLMLALAWELSWGYWMKHLYEVCSCCLSFFTKWWLRYKGNCPRKGKASEGSCITFYDLVSEIHSIISTTFYLLRQSQVPPQDSEKIPLVDGQWYVSGRSCRTGNTGVVIFERQILL